MFVDLKPMEIFENGCVDLGALTTVRATVLNLLEPVKLTVWKVVIERVTVVKFRMSNGGYNGAGCFDVKIWADTVKFTNVIVAGCRKCRNLVREAKLFIENKDKVPSGVGCSERKVVYLRRLRPIKKFSFRRVESNKIGSHPGRDLL